MKKNPARVQLPPDGVARCERAYLHVQRKIAVGELPPGSRVSEPLLARELGISRTPIREATSGNWWPRGCWIKRPIWAQPWWCGLTRQDIVELYELRK